MYEYNLVPYADIETFEYYKDILSNIPDILIESPLEDVDESITQIFNLHGNEIRLKYDNYVDATYIISDVDLSRWLSSKSN